MPASTAKSLMCMNTCVFGSQTFHVQTTVITAQFDNNSFTFTLKYSTRKGVFGWESTKGNKSSTVGTLTASCLANSKFWSLHGAQMLCSMLTALLIGATSPPTLQLPPVSFIVSGIKRERE